MSKRLIIMVFQSKPSQSVYFYSGILAPRHLVKTPDVAAFAFMIFPLCLFFTLSLLVSFVYLYSSFIGYAKLSVRIFIKKRLRNNGRRSPETPSTPKRAAAETRSEGVG